MAYDLENYIAPVWEGDSVCYETVLFVGEEDEAALLYPIDEVLGVYDYGQQIVYTEGVDYVIVDGKIKRLKGGNTPYIPIEEYYRETPAAVNVAVVRERCAEAPEGRGYFMFGEADTFTKRQIAVSYRHKQKWTGAVPQSKRAVFEEALKKLERKEPFDLLFFGDSITTGANSSGLPHGGNTPPYAESFPVMVWKKLQSLYQTEIVYHNTAVGGWNTVQGVENFEEKVLFQAHDLMVLGFGMNDGIWKPEDYQKRMEEMILRFHEANPQSPILLLATMLPNIHSNWLRNQPLHQAKLQELAAKYPFVAVADMTEMHGELLKRKRYRDMTGNNVNHPNDFLARVYAQTILKTILG